MARIKFYNKETRQWEYADRAGSNQSGTVTIDTSLTKSGQAADAKAVGDALEGKQPTGDYALANQIPTKVSQLTNDSGYLTEHQDISGKLDADKLPEAINEALVKAKESGAFDGADGNDGSDGVDGVSPVVFVSAITGGHRITITDAAGETTVDVMDGSDGESGSDGNGIKSAVLNDDYTLTLTFDDGTSYVTPSIRGATGAAGSTGAAGKDGSDGVSVASVEQTTTSTADGGDNVITVTLSNGAAYTFIVRNGSKGSDGAAGYTPVKGVDYFTDSDKNEMIANVKDELTSEDWTFTMEDGTVVTKSVFLK